MPIPLVITKKVRRSTGHIMVTTRYTQTNRDPNRDKVIARLRDDGLGYELQFLLSEVLPVFQNLNKLQAKRRLSDVLPIQQSHRK